MMTRRILYVLGAVAAAGVVTVPLGMTTSSSPSEPGFTMLNANHQCSYCHSLHNGQGGSLQIAADVEVLCLTCHGPGGASALKATNHMTMTCIVCHEPHDGQFNRFGTRNLGMMRSEVIPSGPLGPRPVTFESRGSNVGQPTLHSFCDQDEDNDQIYDNVCDTCHSGNNPGHHLIDDPTEHRHNDGKTCTLSCHPHTRGFLRR